MSLLSGLRKKLARAISPEDFKASQGSGKVPGRGYQFPPWFQGLMRQPWWNEYLAETNGERLKQSPWAYACVRARTDCLPAVQFIAQVWDAENEVWVRDRNHPVEERFDDPNPYQSQVDLLSTNIMDLCIAGNSLTSIQDYDNAIRKREKRFTWRLEALHADYVRPVIDLVDVFAGYAVLKQGWALVGRPPTDDLVPVESMVHVRLPNPLDPLWGLSPLQVASNVLDAEAAAIAWNKGLVENSAKSSMVFSSDQPLERSQWELLVEMVTESYTQAEVGTPMVLSHGLKPIKTSGDPVELDFVNSAYLEATRVCAALRTPPPIIGIAKDATLANLVEYKKQFWTDGIVPDIERILGGYNRSWVWPRWGRGVRLWYDLSNVAALQQDMSLEQKVDTGQKLMAMGYTLNEVNDRLELGMPKTMLGNVRYSAPGLIPMFDDLERTPNILTGALPEDHEYVVMDEEEKAAPYSETGKKAFWKAFEQARERHYGRVEKAAEELMRADLAEFAKAVDGGDLDAVAEEREKAWESFILDTWKEVGDDFYQRTRRQIRDQEKRKGTKNTEPPTSFWDRATQAYIAKYVGEKIRSITRTTRDWVKTVVSRVQLRGEGIDAVANQLETLGPGFSKQRSYTIARTEVIGASNYGGRAFAERSQLVTRKQWISSRDERVRDSHKVLDGQIQDLNKPYSNGLMFPGDPSGKASDLCNCRCVESYIID